MRTVFALYAIIGIIIYLVIGFLVHWNSELRLVYTSIVLAGIHLTTFLFFVRKYEENDEQALPNEEKNFVTFYEETIKRQEKIYNEAKLNEWVTFTLSTMGTLLGLTLIVTSFMTKSDINQLPLVAGVVQGILSVIIFRLHKVESDKFDRIKDSIEKERRDILIPYKLILSLPKEKQETELINFLRKLTEKREQ